MSIVYVNDQGTEITLDCLQNISTATVLKIIAKDPLGRKKTWSATLQGTTYVRYLLQDGDINIPGKWQFQSYIEMPGWKGMGEWATVEVKD